VAISNNLVRSTRAWAAAVAFAIFATSLTVVEPMAGALKRAEAQAIDPKNCPKVLAVAAGLGVKIVSFHRTLQYFPASGGGKYFDNDCFYTTTEEGGGAPIVIAFDFQHPSTLKSVASIRSTLAPPVINVPQLGSNALGYPKTHLLEVVKDDTWLVFGAAGTPLSRMIAYARKII